MADIQSRFISVIIALTSTDFRVIIYGFSAASLLHLSRCCRVLRDKISFLNGSTIRKELDFLYCWHLAYSIRVCTEYNWCHSHSRCRSMPLTNPVSIKNWTIDDDCATAVLIVGNEDDALNEHFSFAFALEATPCISTRSYASNDEVHHRYREDENNTSVVHQTNVVISNEYIMSFLLYYNSPFSQVNIYSRYPFELKASDKLQSKYGLRSVSGQWALLYCFNSSGFGIQTSIIHTDDDMAVVYIANRGSDIACDIKWSLYAYSEHESMKKINSGVFCPLTRNTKYSMARPLGLSHMLIATISIRRRILIHPLDVDPSQAGGLELHRIPDDMLPRRNRLHARFIWPNITKCQHIIGNLCAVYEMEDIENVAVHLVNSMTGQKIRSLGIYPKEYQIDTLMPSMIIIDEDCNDISIIDYGAVIPLE
ncbi:hypothetical protein BDF22DRAFT_662363 [Syncephalis plumigaleata]|nr:hypothetical protein BDF22DRAFT_662363 [Syncephalis plumigaleata]